jgi:hypothetical protein
VSDQRPPEPLHVFLSDGAEQVLAKLSPSELDVVEKLVERLAIHPRLGVPIPGGADPEVDDYTARTEPAADTGDRVSVVYRYHEHMRSVFVTWIIAGP